MPLLSSSQQFVSENVLLDGRLALFHTRERWLAVADLHFGYELSQRAAGNLFPLWGMETIATRLEQLLRDYAPARLVLLGDLVHDCAAAREFSKLINQLGKFCDVILISGNHDRALPKRLRLLESWQSDGFYFHHGHCTNQPQDLVQVIGHHHPAGTIRDGAGLCLKLPALVQEKNCWIMPAFSPWASGTTWQASESSRVWLCSPQRILVARGSCA